MTTPLSAGHLDRRIQFEVPVSTVDALGSLAQGWSVLLTTWASIEPISARHAVLAQRITNAVTHQVNLRWRPELADEAAVMGMRIRHGSSLFRVLSCLDEDQRHMQLILLVATITDGR